MVGKLFTGTPAPSQWLHHWRIWLLVSQQPLTAASFLGRGEVSLSSPLLTMKHWQVQSCAGYCSHGELMSVTVTSCPGCLFGAHIPIPQLLHSFLLVVIFHSALKDLWCYPRMFKDRTRRCDYLVEKKETGVSLMMKGLEETDSLKPTWLLWDKLHDCAPCWTSAWLVSS